MNFDEERIKLQQRLNELNAYETIRNKIVDIMQWDTMVSHPSDDEHEYTWFTEPDEEAYNYDMYIAYKSILDKLDKAMSK